MDLLKSVTGSGGDKKVEKSDKADKVDVVAQPPVAPEKTGPNAGDKFMEGAKGAAEATKTAVGNAVTTAREYITPAAKPADEKK